MPHVPEVVGFWRHVAVRFRLPVGLLLCALAYGTVGYIAIERWSFLDAIYMSVTTLTTVGYREVHQLSTPGRIFTITLVLFGVLVLFMAVAAVAQLLLSGELGEPLRRRRMQRKLDRLEDHYVVCAFGRVGRAAVAEFRQLGVAYVVIETQTGLVPLMEEQQVPYITADPTEEAVLKQAGIERAKGLVCAVDSDAINVYITLTARVLNPTLSIVARASAPESVDQLQRAGADRVVSPYVLSGRRMASLALQPAVVEFIDMVTVAPDMRLEEIVVRPNSPLDGRSVGEACAAHGDLTVLAVKKMGTELIPSPAQDVRFGSGDLVVAMGPVRTLNELGRSP